MKLRLDGLYLSWLLAVEVSGGPTDAMDELVDDLGARARRVPLLEVLGGDRGHGFWVVVGVLLGVVLELVDNGQHFEMVAAKTVTATVLSNDVETAVTWSGWDASSDRRDVRPVLTSARRCHPSHSNNSQDPKRQRHAMSDLPLGTKVRVNAGTGFVRWAGTDPAFAPGKWVGIEL
jgi:hypothetical protein